MKQEKAKEEAGEKQGRSREEVRKKQEWQVNIIIISIKSLPIVNTS